MIILALDLGKFNTMCCIYNSKTRKHEFINATTERNYLTMLRDGKDWDPKQMLSVTESYGKVPQPLKDTLQNMKPKEDSDQRKSRLRKEAREANQANATNIPKAATTSSANSVPQTKSENETPKRTNAAHNSPVRAASKLRSTKPKSKPRRARKLVSAV